MGHKTLYFMCLVWVSFLYTVGILMFSKGFLLKRVVVEQNSTCHVDFAVKADQHGDLGCWMHRRFRRAVIIVVDALRFDFVVPFKRNTNITYHNRFKIVDELLRKNTGNSVLYQFQADPPTTTLQRLKGMTTGSLPTFVDAGSNFGSTEIIEDNYIDQILGLNKKITFMGDDTWLSLFPNQFNKYFSFPSFNVKDLHTVDNGVLDHLEPELRKNDWDILIAHFLGVDHCGHTYGPYHPAMVEKLDQMDRVIRSVVREIKEDTVLFVLGDHGMTRTGDHGGDSTDELNAALFIYSPSQLTAHKYTPDHFATVSQTDLVPTVSLLLGTPIPFSSLGVIITDLFSYCPWWKMSGDPIKQVYHTVKALRLNAHQVRRYLITYQHLSKEFSARQIDDLEDRFDHSEKVLQELVTAVHLEGDSRDLLPRLENMRESYLRYLSDVRSMCERVWAKFDLNCILLGIVIVLTALLLNTVLYNIRLDGDKLPLIFHSSLLGSLWCFLLCLFLYFSDLTISSLISSLTVGLLTLGFLGLMFHKVLSYDPNKKVSKDKRSMSFFTFQNLSGHILNVFATLCMFLYAGSLTSNSFVVFEDTVTSYCFQSLLWVHLYQISVKLSWKQKSDILHNRKQPRTAFDIIRVITSPRGILLLLVLTACLCVRLSKNFRACREEQWTCEPSEFMQSLSMLTDDSRYYKHVRYFLSATSVFLIYLAVQRWMRHHGNLNGYFPGVLMISYGMPVSVICVCFYWALQALPRDVLDSLPVWQLVLLPRIVYVLFALALIITIVKPLFVYLLPANQTDTNISGKSKEEITPKLYNQIKLNWRKYFPSSKDLAEEEQKRPPVVYGLATVYSATFIMLTSMMAIFLVLLLGDNIAPSMTCMLLAMFLLLEMHSATRRCDKSLPDARVIVPWSSVFTWGVLASHYFFATGHQSTVTTIRWESAYIGFHGDFEYYALPATWIFLNTFASQVLFTVGLPLLLFWPYVRGCLMFTFTKDKMSDEEDAQDRQRKGELVLHEDHEGMGTATFQLILGYLLFHGCKVFAAMCSAGLHRRHLMVWKIFAPRFIFEAASFLWIVGLLLMVYFLVFRTDRILTKWLKTLSK